jgi:hypothetical protein
VDILLITLAAFATAAGYKQGLPALVGVLAVFLLASVLGLLGMAPGLYAVLVLLLGAAIVIVVNIRLPRLSQPAIDASAGALGGLLVGAFLFLAVYGAGNSGSLPPGLHATLDRSPLAEALGDTANRNGILAHIMGSQNQNAPE